MIKKIFAIMILATSMFGIFSISEAHHGNNYDYECRDGYCKKNFHDSSYGDENYNHEHRNFHGRNHYSGNGCY